MARAHLGVIDSHTDNVEIVQAGFVRFKFIGGLEELEKFFRVLASQLFDREYSNAFKFLWNVRPMPGIVCNAVMLWSFDLLALAKRVDTSARSHRCQAVEKFNCRVHHLAMEATQSTIWRWRLPSPPSGDGGYVGFLPHSLNRYFAINCNRSPILR